MDACGAWAQACSWSRNGRHVLSSAMDWHVLLWDVLEGTVARKMAFESPVLAAAMHPRFGPQLRALECIWHRNNNVLVALPLQASPVLVAIDNDARRALPVWVSDGSSAARMAAGLAHARRAAAQRDGSRVQHRRHQGDACIAWGSCQCAQVFVANSKCQVLIVDTATLAIDAHFAVPAVLVARA